MAPHDGVAVVSGAVREIETAAKLMRLALALLNKAGAETAAARLRHAIEEADRGACP